MLPEDIHIPKKSTAESGKYFLTCGHKGKNHYEYFYSKNLWFLRDELRWTGLKITAGQRTMTGQNAS
jgi:hypothetical protein